MCYFGLSEQRVLSQEEFEQKVEQEEAGIAPQKYNTMDKQSSKAGQPTVLKPDNTDSTQKTEPAPLIDAALFAQLIHVMPGAYLQTIADYWTNGILVPANATFEVILSPKKIRRVQKTEIESNKYMEYFVHGKVLLDSGRTLDFRMSLSNCKLPSLPVVSNQDDDLKW